MESPTTQRTVLLYFDALSSPYPQACRTPSRNDAGIETLAKYFSHIPLLESRFFSATRQMGIFFTWYVPPHCLQCPVNHGLTQPRGPGIYLSPGENMSVSPGVIMVLWFH